jgi:hypothetical protein
MVSSVLKERSAEGSDVLEVGGNCFDGGGVRVIARGKILWLCEGR